MLKFYVIEACCVFCVTFRATRRHCCAGIVLGLVLLLLIIVLLVSSIDIRTSIGQFMRHVGLSVDWRLRHVNTSPPV